MHQNYKNYFTKCRVQKPSQCTKATDAWKDKPNGGGRIKTEIRASSHNKTILEKPN